MIGRYAVIGNNPPVFDGSYDASWASSLVRFCDPPCPSLVSWTSLPYWYEWVPWFKSWRARFPQTIDVARVIGSVRTLARTVHLAARTATVRSASRWHGGRPKRR